MRVSIPPKTVGHKINVVAFSTSSSVHVHIVVIVIIVVVIIIVVVVIVVDVVVDVDDQVEHDEHEVEEAKERKVPLLARQASRVRRVVDQHATKLSKKPDLVQLAQVPGRQGAFLANKIEH